MKHACEVRHHSQQQPSAEMTVRQGDVLTREITLVDIVAGGEAARAGQTCTTNRNMHQTSFKQHDR